MKTALGLLVVLAAGGGSLAAQSASRLHFELQLDGSALYSTPVIGAVSSSGWNCAPADPATQCTGQDFA